MERSGADLSRYSTRRTDTDYSRIQDYQRYRRWLEDVRATSNDAPSINDVTVHVMGDAAYATHDMHKESQIKVMGGGLCNILSACYSFIVLVCYKYNDIKTRKTTYLLPVLTPILIASSLLASVVSTLDSCLS